MTKLKGLVSVVSQLRLERTNLANQLRDVDAALSILGRLDGDPTKARRAISAAGRRRIAAAQKTRWAKVRGQKVVPIARKRVMSASARRKIAAAQRARWAKVKAEKKAA